MNVKTAAALIFAFAITLVGVSSPALADATARTEHVALASSIGGPAEPGRTVWLAIRFEVAPHWHVYWQNPGDTGLPTRIAWTLPKGVTAGVLKWPAPQRLAADGVVNFGYSGTFALLAPLQIGTDAILGGHFAKASVTWLACAEMCVPEQADLEIPLDSAGEPRAIAAAFGALPKSLPGTADASVSQNAITLIVNAPGLRDADPRSISFFPQRAGVVDYDLPLSTSTSDGKIIVRMSRAGSGHQPDLLSGILRLGNGKGYEIAAAIHAIAVSSPVSTGNGISGLLGAIVFAFVGGIVLNFMPCVLPVLSMKALALARTGDDVGALKSDGIAYLAGVWVTFLSVVVALIGLKAASAAVGWGFQLQSPAIVFGLFLLMGTIGLNLLGLFEVPLAFAGVGERLTHGNTSAGAFFTGVLAVMVASPCTAPFMGAALGYAMTQSAGISLLVFLAMATGFAAPVTMMSFLPGVVRIFPRPGPWMVRFREFLAFPMFATTIWLLWVLDRQLGPLGLALALSVALGLAFLAWVVRHSRRGLRGAALGAALSLLLWAFLSLQPMAGKFGGQPTWQPWSARAVDDARRAGKPVLVDFTAAWCVTCLVNERVALENPLVVSRLRQDNVVMLRADWTDGDSGIAAELTRHGRAGVPLYLIYPRGIGGDALVLPQILTPGNVIDALKRSQNERSDD